MNSTRPALITWIVVSMVLATTAMQAQFTIELEDYNFEDGQFIDKATPGDYGGKGLATPGVDFVDNTPTTRGANEYRAPGAGASGLPQTAASGDSERAAGTAERRGCRGPRNSPKARAAGTRSQDAGR